MVDNAELVHHAKGRSSKSPELIKTIAVMGFALLYPSYDLSSA
jgi:hypothetical protein